MSSKKNKIDLLVRVRYSNPLPAPPCPPKLLEIPTNPKRYTRPAFLNEIAAAAPLPMIVDAECGMPLDLGQWESLWVKDADDKGLNPDPTNLPTLDPEDELLLVDPTTSSGAYMNGSGPSTTSSLPVHVPWLRKTEYIAREAVSRASASQEVVRHDDGRTIDVSRPAQLRDIEASFAACNGGAGGDPFSFDLDGLRHPTKPGVRAVESFEVLPDADVWANAYDLFRFSERPGERPVDVDDPRLDCAVLRPMESDGDHFLAYYLTEDDDAALKYKERRNDAALSDESTAFHFQRDYETVKVEQDVPNEFLLVLDNGTGTGMRGAGAYYKNIERKMTLKKRRVNQYEDYQDKWQIVHITHVRMDEDEAVEREDAQAEVADPAYLERAMALSRGDADAEGEVEVEVDADGEGEGEGEAMQVDSGIGGEGEVDPLEAL